jgi:hypothetical protein
VGYAKADTNYSLLSLPSVYGFNAACHILIFLSVISFAISDLMERAGHLAPEKHDSGTESARSWIYIFCKLFSVGIFVFTGLLKYPVPNFYSSFVSLFNSSEYLLDTYMCQVLF